MPAKITKAFLSEIEILNKISIASKAYWGYPDEWMEKWHDALLLSDADFDDHIIFKIEDEESIIGFCVMTEHLEAYEVLHLWILPDFIGKGYGKKLLNHTIKQVVTKNKPIIVEADPNAEAFYISQGFVTFDQVESEPKGRFLPVMRKG
jgi:GNAT superfamily N-acetyltransferase